MTYAGLTTADKGALLDAKAQGAEWVARDKNSMICGYASKPIKRELGGEWYTDDGFELEKTNKLQFVKWSDAEPANIDLALAQIAEMEKAQKPLTVNEWLNISTADQKAKWLYDMDVCRISSISAEECSSYGHCIECMKNMLNSPYTEGETT